MTTTIKVTSHNYPALVTTTDRAGPDNAVISRSERVLRPSDGEVVLYCTTSRTVEVTDIDYNDPRVLALAAVDDQ